MKKFQVYISCPMSVPQSKIDAYVRTILNLGADVEYWLRGTTYNTYAISRAQAVVVLLNDNKWKEPFSQIPKGTKSEIQYAWDHDIPVFLGYVNSSTENAIYNTVLVNISEVFTGIPGSSDRFGEMIKKWNDQYDNLSDVEKIEQTRRDHIIEYYEDKRGPTPIVIERNAKGEPLVSASFKIIDLSTPREYDRRLLLLLR